MNPIEQRKVSILNMARGALAEEVDIQLCRVAQNILDPNTDAKPIRSITIKLDFKTDDEREITSVKATTTSKLAPSKPVTTQIAFGDDKGEFVAVELTKHIPGQLGIDGSTEPPGEVFHVGVAR